MRPTTARSAQRAPAALRSKAALAMLLLACAEDPVAPGGGTNTPPPPNLPHSPAVVSAADQPAPGGGGPHLDSGIPAGVAWVSMAPGTDSAATSVEIVNRRGGPTVNVLPTDGGFDPVQVTAVAGDTLVLTLKYSAGPPKPGYAVVPETSRPIIVRTSPPNRKTDVPLNATVRIVFSEPMDTASLSKAVTLRWSGGVVPGTVRAVPILGGADLGAEFTPLATLLPSTPYTIEVSTAATSAHGVQLGASMSAAFTTDTTATDTLPQPPDTLPQLFQMSINLPSALSPGGGSVLAGASMPVSVTYQGCLGCDTTPYSGSVSVVLIGNQSGARLLGTTTVPMVDGVATFNGLAVDQEGTYQLIASAPGARSDTSFSFSVCASDCWVERAPMPTRRVAMGVAAVDGVLYAIGGAQVDLGLSPAPTGMVEAYDPATDTWTPRAPMPTPRYGFGIGVVHDTIYVVGGVGATGAIAIVEAYDPVTNRWAERTALPAPRGFPGVGVVNGELYVIGGQAPDSTVLGTVLTYDLPRNAWAGRASMPTPRSHIGVGEFGGLLYAMAGLTTPVPTYTTVTGLVEVYDPVSDTWASRAPGGYTAGRLLPGIGVLPEGIYILSGVDGVTYLSDPYGVGSLYNPSSDQFIPLKPTPFGAVPNSSLQAVAVANGKLYLIGHSTFVHVP